MRTLHRNLTVQVLIAISLGVLLGLVAPGVARGMRPVGDTFVNLVRMVIAPVIFLTVTLGIANMRDLKKVGRVGGKALLYFEIVTTFALAIGMVVVAPLTATEVPRTTDVASTQTQPEAPGIPL